MFSACSELTPRAPFPDGRVERIMQPCVQVEQLDIVQVVQCVYWLKIFLAHYRLCPCCLPRSWHVPGKQTASLTPNAHK